MRTIECHPERAYYAKGKCRQCYDQVYFPATYERRQPSIRNTKYRARYGITLFQYERMLIQQDHLCAVCLQPDPNKRLSIDHDHDTKRVRGLLCQRCNQGIVTVGITPEMLRRAADYMEHSFDGRSL